MNDLDQLLKDCGSEIKPPPNFHSNVWLRIEAAESAGGLRRLFEGISLRLVSLSCAASIIIGAWLSLKMETFHSEGKTTYVQLINPLHPSR